MPWFREMVWTVSSTPAAVPPTDSAGSGRRSASRTIIDGTSNTIAFVETTIGPGKNATPPDPSVEQHADPRKWRAVASASTAVDWLFNGYGTVNGWEGSKSTVWLRGSVPNGAVLAVPLTPNSKIPDFTQQSGKAAASRSYHTGGVSVLLADGSARFVSDNIDRDTWHALLTRAGGEVVGEF